MYLLFIYNKDSKKYLYSLFSIIAFLMMPTLHAQVSGTVFRDFNANGTKDNTATFNEVGLEGITATAYDATGAAVGTDTSAPDGTYTITGVSGAVRVEFTGLQTGDYSSKSGGTSVQFVNAPATGVNFAVNYPLNYSQSDPKIIMPVFNDTEPTGSTSNGLLDFNYNQSGIPNSANYPSGGLASIPRKVADFNETGSLWGVAWDRKNKKLYSSAFLKRHVGFGPRGADGIYLIDYSGTAPTYLGGFDLEGIIPNNGGTAISLGTVTRSIISTAISPGAVGDNQLTNLPNTPSRDLDAFAKVGKMSYGDIETDETGNYLWVVNLYQRSLIRIDISNPISDLTNIPNTLPSAIVNQYMLDDAIGIPTCNSGILRPFSLKFYKGKGYLGLVCDGSTSLSNSDISAYILSFDPEIPNVFTLVKTFPLNYYRESPEANQFLGDQPGTWNAWVSTFEQANSVKAYPQPILSSIEFTETDDMILGLMDRYGAQLGHKNYIPVSGSTTMIDGLSAGDILKLCENGNEWLLEGQSSACAESDDGSPFDESAPLDGSFGAKANDGLSGTGEFFYKDYFDGHNINNNAVSNHLEISQGANVVLFGTQEVINTVYDPILNIANSDGYIFTQGIHFYSTTSGNITDTYMAVPYNETNGLSPGKGLGLGDIELLQDPAPLEIGNRIWSDTDRDGIQDANELGIDGISVELYEGTTLVGTTTTANGGQWYFNNSNVNLNGATELKPNTAYTIRVLSSEFPSGQTLTTANNDGTTNGDARDNDASLVGGNAEIAYTTGGYGQNDHTLDIGLRLPTPDLSLTKTVNTAIATLNSQVTFTLTLTNDNSIDATGVVVTDQLPAGVTYVSSSDPANVSVSGSTITWNVGTFLGTDAPKTLDITVTASNEGSFVNNAEITTMNETDGDSTPNNDVAGEDDQDQACFSVPVSLCSDNATAAIIITAGATASYQWYVSTDNGATYTALSGEINQTLTINNTLMGGNNVTKYFKVAYNGASITGTCGEVMCCPVIVTTQTCTVCPVPKCIPIAISKANP